MNYDALRRGLKEYLDISYAELGLLTEKGENQGEKGKFIMCRIGNIKALLIEMGWVEDSSA